MALFTPKDDAACTYARALLPSGATARLCMPLFTDARDDVVRAIVHHIVEPDEIVLGARRSRSPLSDELVDSRRESSKVRLLYVSDVRALVVSVSQAGAVRVAPFQARDTSKIGDKALRQLAELTRSPRGTRLVRAVMQHLATARARDHDAARALVSLLVADGDARGIVTAMFFDAIQRNREPSSAQSGVPRPTGETLAGALLTLARESPSGDALVELANLLALSVDERLFLVDRARAQGLDARWSLPLHESTLARESESAPVVERALARLVLGEHALDAGAVVRAKEVTETAQSLLPPVVDEDILDQGENSVGVLRARALHLMARARGERSVELAFAIARATPFSAEAWRALAAAHPRESRAHERALAVAALVDGSTLASTREDDFVDTEVHALNADDRAAVLGPRSSRDPLFAMQVLLAEVDAPDARALLDYCERATASRAPVILRAAAEAATLLGLPLPSVFISRGARAIGVRAHAGATPLLLVGMAHLAEGEMPLGPRGARFVIGSELAHLAFGHTRFTADDVWNGVLKKGKASLGLVLGLLPSGGSVGQMKKLLSFAAQASALTKGQRRDVALGGLSQPSEDFVRAHRVMQRRADRVGLLLADDPTAALRAICATEPRYDALLLAYAEQGLARALLRRDPQGFLLLPELAIRVADLLTFYVDKSAIRLTDRVRTVHADKNAAK